MTKNFVIRSFMAEDIGQVKSFTDTWIGTGYYKEEELARVLEISTLNGRCCSYLAFDQEKLVAVRLTFAPGTWAKDITRGLTPDSWKIPFEKMAYFKSLFVHEDYQGQGLGKSLSQKSIETLKEMGAQGILCHSWIESPGDSSRRYLKRMNFEQVAEHKEYWKPIDYLCTRCTPNPCVCTAAEMVYYI